MIIKTILRFFIRNKLVFSLCVLGLSIGFAVFITVLMHYRFEHSYDNMHKNAKKIYRMHAIYGTTDGYINTYATSDNGYGPTLKEELPEVLDYVRMIAYQSERIVSYAPESGAVVKFREPNVFLVDSNFFSFFDYKLKVGSAKEVLNRPNTMVISESAAKKYFGNENPVGKLLSATDRGNPFECEITGVFYDVPDNSNLQFDFLMSMGTVKQRWASMDNSWNFAISYTYLHLADDVDIEKFKDQVMDVFFKRSGIVPEGDLVYDMQLTPFEEIHLNEPLQWELEKKGNRAETRYLLIIAIVTILISWLNQINIKSSLNLKRNNNVRIRFILGSGRRHHILHNFVESFIINLVSVCIAILLILIAAPLISTFFQHNGIAFIFNDPFIIWLIVGILLVGTILTGVIAALFFFINNPDFLIKTNLKSTASQFRRIMVVAQFTAAVVLMIGTLIVYKQIQFLHSQELGVNLNQVLVIKAPAGLDAQPKSLEKFRQSLADNPTIIKVSAGSDVPGQFMDMGWRFNRTSVNPPVNEAIDGGRVDYDYVETLGLELVAGADFDRGMNTERKILINEETVRLARFESPEQAVGQQIQLPEMYGDQAVTILGVLKNYRQQSPNHAFKPMFLFCVENGWLRINYFLVKYSGNEPDLISLMSEKWKQLFPSSSFDYFFLNDHYEKQYSGNTRFGKLLGILCLMAILISILGLFGLSINTTQQRVKEIGIRKVNGARVKEILALLNKDFGRWIFIAVVLGSVIAYFVMKNWLETFPIQTSISWWIFALTGILTIGIGLLTVSFQSWRAATRNPVEALRYE